jgi:CheY-like chemotaxis protein
MFLSRLISKAFPNAEIMQAENGQEAVEIIAGRLASATAACVDTALSPAACLPWSCGAGQRRSAVCGAVPCAITLDREMPVLDGPAAARLLRGRLGYSGLIAGVTSCSRVTSGDLIEAGADCVLQKGSITIDTLRRLLGPAVAAATTPTASAAAHPIAPSAGVDGDTKDVCAASALTGPLVAAEQPAVLTASAPSPSAGVAPRARPESVKSGGTLPAYELAGTATATASADAPGPSAYPAYLAPPFPAHPPRTAPHRPAARAAHDLDVSGGAAAAGLAEGVPLVASARTSRTPGGGESPPHPILSDSDGASAASLPAPARAAEPASVPPPRPLPLKPRLLETALASAAVSAPSSPVACDHSNGLAC